MNGDEMSRAASHRDKQTSAAHFGYDIVEIAEIINRKSILKRRIATLLQALNNA